MIFVQLLFSLSWLEDFYLVMKWLLAKAAWIYQNGHQLPSQPSYPSLFSSLRRWRYRAQMRSVFSYYRHDILDQRTCLIVKFPVQCVNRALPKSDLVCILRASTAWNGFAFKYDFLNSPYLIFTQSTIIIDACNCPLNIGRLFQGIALRSHRKRQKSMWTCFDFLPNTPHFHAKFHITIKPMIGCGNWNQTSCHPGFQNEVMGVAVKNPSNPGRRFLLFSWLCRLFLHALRTNFVASLLVHPARQKRHATQATKLQQQQENKKANYQDCVHEKCTFH